MLELNDASAVPPPPSDTTASQTLQGVRQNYPSTRDVIEKATPTFVAGHIKNKAFIEKIRKDSGLKEQIRNLLQKFPQLKDAHFTWDANRIEGSSYVASAGPKSMTEVGLLIKNTVYNTDTPIRHIIALGSCLAYDPFDHQDFHDYCIKERVVKFGDYQTSIKKIQGESEFTVSGHQTIPYEVVQSVLSISPLQGESDVSNQKLYVTLIPLDDNCAIRLSDEGQYKDGDGDPHPSLPIPKYLEYLKETLWQLFEKSLHETILIHCAAGVGRTGHLILTFEILKHYDQVFVSNDPDVIVQEIHAILDRLRKNRPALVATKIQFEKAISNAVALHEYALSKGYIQTNTVFSKALFSEPEVKQEAPVLEESESAPTTNSDVSNNSTQSAAGLVNLGVFGSKNPNNKPKNLDLSHSDCSDLQVNTM